MGAAKRESRLKWETECRQNVLSKEKGKKIEQKRSNKAVEN
jgi:hypothetical protein